MKVDYRELDSLQLDALREVGNIGAAHAATTLSKILDKEIMITVSNLSIVEVNNIADIFGGANVQTTVARMHVVGDLNGEMLLAFKKEASMRFADMLQGKEQGFTIKFDEIDISALKEAGNILAASYLLAIGDFLKITLIPSTPSLITGKVSDLLREVLNELSKRANVAFCIDTVFSEKLTNINGHLILLPDLKSLELMLKSLGVFKEQ